MKRIRCLRMLSLAAMAFALAIPAGAEDFPVITASELKGRMDKGERIFLLNPLSDLEYQEQHIPGSVNIPLESIETTLLLPEDKQQPIVTYCLGPQ